MLQKDAAAIEDRIAHWHVSRGTCDHPGPSRGITLYALLRGIARDWKIMYDTARSIYAQKMRYIAKSKEERAFIRRPRNLLAEYQAYLAARAPHTPGGAASAELDRSPPPCMPDPHTPHPGQPTGQGRTMLDLAIDIRYPPSRLAVRLLTEILDPAGLDPASRLCKELGKWRAGGKKDKIPKAAKQQINQLYYKGPALLDEPFPLDPKAGPWDITVLHRHLVECVRADATEGPLVERIKQNIGLEYEYILQEQLKRAGIQCLSEEELKVMQAVCTPDCVLMQPIEVCGQLVNWIDSKACFGDAETLAENFGQFSRYVNEVGPGLVIYWFGFVEDAAKATHSLSLEYNISAWATQGIQVASRLPETIIKPKGASMKVPTSYTGRALSTSPLKAAGAQF